MVAQYDPNIRAMQIFRALTNPTIRKKEWAKEEIPPKALENTILDSKPTVRIIADFSQKPRRSFIGWIVGLFGIEGAGGYDLKTDTILLRPHKNPNDLARTLAHEHKHYLDNRGRSKIRKWLHVLTLSFGPMVITVPIGQRTNIYVFILAVIIGYILAYFIDPMEIRARRYEKAHWPEYKRLIEQIMTPPG